MKRLLAALLALLISTPAFADALIDNVNGITLDKDGKVVRFTGLVISTQAWAFPLKTLRFTRKPAEVSGRVMAPARSPSVNRRFMNILPLS